MGAICEQWILQAYAVTIKTMVLLLPCQNHLPGRGGLVELEFHLKTVLTFLLLAPLFPFLLHLSRNNPLEFYSNFAFYRIFFSFFSLKNILFMSISCVWVFCLHVDLCTIYMQCLQRPEGGTRSSCN